MPNSLRCMLSKLRHKGQISDAEYKELITKLDNHDKVIKEQTNTAEWIESGKQGGIPISYKCSNCDFWWNNNKFRYCPNCGSRMKGDNQ